MILACSRRRDAGLGGVCSEQKKSSGDPGSLLCSLPVALGPGFVMSLLHSSVSAASGAPKGPPCSPVPGLSGNTARLSPPERYLGPFSALHGHLLSGVRTTPRPSAHFWGWGGDTSSGPTTETRWGPEGG